MDTDGTAIGSVSGGCVEGAVYDLCQQALLDGETVLERFGYSDDDAFAVGLTCGGVIDILVTPVRAKDPARPTVAAALSAAASGSATALARIVSGPAELLGRALAVRPDDSHSPPTTAASAPTPNWTARSQPRPVPIWTRAAPARSRSASRVPAAGPRSRSWSSPRCRRPG